MATSPCRPPPCWAAKAVTQQRGQTVTLPWQASSPFPGLKGPPNPSPQPAEQAGCAVLAPAPSSLEPSCARELAPRPQLHTHQACSSPLLHPGWLAGGCATLLPRLGGCAAQLPFSRLPHFMTSATHLTANRITSFAHLAPLARPCLAVLFEFCSSVCPPPPLSLPYAAAALYTSARTALVHASACPT